MRFPISRASLILFLTALFLAACQSLTSVPGNIANLLTNPARGRVLAIHFRGAHPSHA
jgi:hypothetical protein